MSTRRAWHQWMPGWRSRAGVAGPWTPAEASNLLWWLDATDAATITKDGSDLVSAWGDKSASNFDVTEGTGASQPTYLATGLNSGPCIEFLGKRLTGAFAHTGQGGALFIVCTVINAGSSGGRVVCFAEQNTASTGANGWEALRRNGSLQSVNSAYANASYGGQGITYEVPFLWTAMRDGSLGYTGKDGATVGSTSSVSTADYDRVAVGTSLAASGAIGSTVAHTRVAEIVMLSTKPTTDLQQRIEGYLADKYGITLASGHPYEDAPP